MTDGAAAFPDRGSLHADLVAVVDRLVEAEGTPAARQAVCAALDGAGAAAPLELPTVLAVGERAAVLAALDRAVQRREVATRPDPQLVHAILVGTVFAALFLVRFDPADLPARLARVVQAAFAAERVPDFGRV